MGNIHRWYVFKFRRNLKSDVDNIDDITESLADEPRFVKLGVVPNNQPLAFDVDKD